MRCKNFPYYAFYATKSTETNNKTLSSRKQYNIYSFHSLKNISGNYYDPWAFWQMKLHIYFTNNLSCAVGKRSSYAIKYVFAAVFAMDMNTSLLPLSVSQC